MLKTPARAAGHGRGLRALLAELARLPRIDRLDLVRLSHDEVAEQLAGILGSAPSAGLVRRIHERSEGNPFFAEELLAAGAEGARPDTLRDALLLRKTASAHVSHILEKLAARNRGEAAAIAARLGLDNGSPGPGS
jgi:hypothetical protein